MNFRGCALATTLVLTSSLATGCSRSRQEAVLLANQGDAIVELDPSGAIEKYQNAVNLDADNHQIKYKLARAHKKKDEWAKVAEVLGRATDQAPSFANYWKERGYALYKQAEAGNIEYDEAKEPFKKCIEADANQEECYYWLAHAFLWSDKEQDALQYYTKAIEVRPTRIEYYAPLADLYIRLGYLQEAEQVLNAAKSLADPGKDAVHLFDVHTLLGGVYRDKDDIDKMVSEFEAARALKKDDPSSLFNLGMGYAKQDGKKAESLQLLKGFQARGCKSKKAQKLYKSECAQARAEVQRLKGPST
ncbi:MAG: tetratricopeptide repeat protein [Myxococcota bacterium]